MNEFWAIFLIIFVVFGISFFLINIRHIVTGKEFRGTCASNNPMVKDKFGNCNVCGKSADDICENPDVQKGSSFPTIN